MILKQRYKLWLILPMLLLGLSTSSSLVFADDNQQNNFDTTEFYMGAPDKQKIILLGSTSYLSNPRNSDYMDAKKSGSLYFTTTVGHMRQVLRKAGINLHQVQNPVQNGARVYQIGMLQDLEIMKGNTQLPIYIVKSMMIR
ncbi:hypothetical protein GA0061074_10932 [Weissella bombi]|uniref:Uncharacterized protein n=2 Tax=Weissella bombi TaxID=1505725 RepID=A0A1C4B7V9_9LACO|nr:hypothetical protein GA0061074_10932 [Weissella bombi]